MKIWKDPIEGWKYEKERGENINTEAYWDKKHELSKNYHTIDFKEQSTIISRYIPMGSSVLDIGCGNGDFLKFLKVNNITNDLYGADISSYVLELIKTKVPAKLIKLCSIPSELPTKEIDVITIIHLVEHLENPEEYLRLWFKSLKEDGIVILAIPLNDEPYAEHLRIYTLDDVKNLIRPLCINYDIITRDRMEGKKEAIAVLRFKRTKVVVQIDPHITYDKTFVPNTIYLETTNYCNATCYMCPNKNLERYRGFMSWELFEKIIGDCKEIEGKGINFYLHHCGEPLLDPLLTTRIAHIKSQCKKSNVLFSTNGSLLTKEKSEEILKAGLDFIVISLDSLNEKTYSEIRSLQLGAVIKNVNDLIEVRDKLKSKVAITMQMVICDKNKNEEQTFRDMWKGKNVRVVIKYMHDFLTQRTSYLTNKLSDRQLFPCMQPFMYQVIYWNGDLGLCCWDADRCMDLGNIKDKTVLEAFNTEQYKKIRQAMLIRDCKNIPPCNKCSQIYGHDMNVSIFDTKVRIKKDV